MANIYLIDSMLFIALSTGSAGGWGQGAKVGETTDLEKRRVETQAEIVMFRVNKVGVPGNI
jgi:hypothetical protein